MPTIWATSSSTIRGNVRIACQAICATNIPHQSEEVYNAQRRRFHYTRCRTRERLLRVYSFDCSEQRATVSLHSRQKRKERIQTAARRLGYRPNPLARSLRSQRSNIVGVMVFDITDPFCTPILRGLENALYQANYLSLLADAHNEPHRFERYLEMLLDRRVEGLIVIANWLVTDIKVLADLTEKQVPTVIAGRAFEIENVSTVSVDNEGGAATGAGTSVPTRPSRDCLFARAKNAGEQRATVERHPEFCAVGGIAAGCEADRGIAGIAGS